MIKLLALDMDGTLLNSQKQISEANKEAIALALETGTKIVLCTGRPLSGVLPFAEELGFNHPGEYVIVNNGCSIHQAHDLALIDYKSLSHADIDILANYRDGDKVQLTLFDESRYLVLDEQASAETKDDAAMVFAEPVYVDLEAIYTIDVPIFQAMFIGPKEAMDTLEHTHEKTLSGDFDMVRSSNVLYEALPKGANKASALAHLAERLDIAPSEIMAIGDGNNDLEMLRFAHHSVAMGNASSIVKEASKYETKTNDQAGVAHAIKTWLL